MYTSRLYIETVLTEARSTNKDTVLLSKMRKEISSIKSRIKSNPKSDSKNAKVKRYLVELDYWKKFRVKYCDNVNASKYPKSRAYGCSYSQRMLMAVNTKIRNTRRSESDDIRDEKRRGVNNPTTGRRTDGRGMDGRRIDGRGRNADDLGRGRNADGLGRNRDDRYRRR